MKVEKRQKGFTLTELVAVILVLALLAVFAIPRYVKWVSEGRKSVILGIEAALQSAVAVTKARAKLEGKNRGTETTVTLENVWGGAVTVDVTEELVPKATMGGMGRGWGNGALHLPYLYVDGRYVISVSYASTAGWNYIDYAISAVGSTCQVEYWEWNSGAVNGIVSITTTLTGC